MKIRPASLDDAASIARLLEELGYPQPPEFVHNRLQSVFVDADQRVWVAEDEAQVLGFIAFLAYPYFHAVGKQGRIIALCVTEANRGKGVGRALVEHSESFARSCGCVRMEVTTGIQRLRTHTFYEQMGYKETSKRYLKDL